MVRPGFRPVAGVRPERATNLRRVLPDFVGRTRELAEVETALGSSSGLVTITGPSGIGKSRLAFEVAGRVSDAYPGGTWLAELRPITDGDAVPHAVASALGIDPEPARDPIDVIVAHLPRAPVLLVLDNCEHLLGLFATLIERLLASSHDLTVLATSQQALGLPAETVLDLAPLSLPPRGRPSSVETALDSEAVALFCTRASAGHSGFLLTLEVLPAVIDVCRRLDGVPLAIELAAARAAVLSPAEIAERLDERFALLTTSGPGTSRHASLRAALDWSYQLLSGPEAALLRRLSVFAGTAELQAVQRVCIGGEVERDDLVDLMSSLVAKSLVQADTSGARARYSVLGSIQAYGRERLADAGEADLVELRHASWCVTLAERCWHQGDAGTEIKALEADYDNLRVALQRSVGGLDPDLGLRLSSALTPYWRLRGLVPEGQSWLERALAAGDDAPPALRARALSSLASLATLRGDIDIARASVEESLEIARAQGYDRPTTAALNLLGFISIFTQDADAALPLLEESVARARSAGDTSALTWALGLSGRAYLFLGELEEARSAFEECLLLSDGVESPGGLIGLGWVALAQGRLGEAHEVLSAALPSVRRAGDRFEIAVVSSFLGELAWARGDLGAARAAFEDGMELAGAMGAPFPLARCLLGLGLVAHVEGDLDGAARLVDDAVSRARHAQLPYALIRCLHGRGDIRWASDHPAGARADYDEALALARRHRDKGGVAGSLDRLARLARQDGDADKAVPLAHQALALSAEVGDAAGVARGLELLGGLALDQGRDEHGARLFGAAATGRSTAGATRPAHESSAYDAGLAELRRALPSDQLDEAWAQGRALSQDEAVALASRGRGPRVARGSGLASLTASERRVAELAAEGLTNREIAVRLFVSPRTVQGHLARTYRKLGLSSRRQLRELHREQ